MPIYEYRCADCGFQDEYLQKVSEPPLTQCPSCGKATFAKMLSAAGFQLKGSGWYATDFKGAGASKPGGADAAAAKGDAKAEATSAAKTESAKTESAKSEPAKAEPAAAASPAAPTK